MMLLKACTKCHGDLMQDGDELHCWQCGIYYYPNIEIQEIVTVKYWCREGECSANYATPESLMGHLRAKHGIIKKRVDLVGVST
jgi:hypothetical protein